MLKARKPDTEIQQVLRQQYVEPVINNQPGVAMLVSFLLLPNAYRDRSYYQYLTGLAIQLLKAEWDEADIIDGLLPTLPEDQLEKYQQPATKKIRPVS